ncbi:MAG: Cell division protein FtsA [Patescibacteria group bacterium]|nr:Cell division protein FtsA [Patescibacteria group bacterium]
MSSYILALDLGTARIKALVAQMTGPDTWQIVFPAIRKSQGIKQGMIDNLESVVTEVDNLLTEMEGANKNFIFKQAIIGINGPHLETRLSKGVSVISRPDGEITEDDKERALKAAQACVLPANRVLSQTTVRNYLIDGTTKVKDPLGMKGLRLEIECLLIDAFSPVVRNIDRLGETLGLNFSKVILPYAGAELALTTQDKELGAAALDLGAATTGFCVYEDGELLDLKVFPVGGNNITNDIAVGLKTYVDIAEKIKISEGLALAKKAPKGAEIDLKPYFEDLTSEEVTINKKFLAEIIEARLSEIFEMVGDHLKELDRFGKLPGGIVLYGGGAQLPFITELAKDKFKLPVRLAKPEIEWYQETNDPSFIPVLGLINFARQQLESGKNLHFNNEGFFKKLASFVERHFSI